jgi:hypothetical protein
MNRIVTTFDLHDLFDNIASHFRFPPRRTGYLCRLEELQGHFTSTG